MARIYHSAEEPGAFAPRRKYRDIQRTMNHCDTETGIL